jgi:phosphoribosylpyrophosphate synthetase
MERSQPYIDTIGPEKDDQGRIVYGHAVEIPRAYGAFLWQTRINELKLIGAENSHQIVILPTGSLTDSIAASDEYPFVIGKNPVAVARVSRFPDNEDLEEVENEVPAVRHTTIIASPRNYPDLYHIMQVAAHYKEVLGTKHVTLFTPYLTTTRQDKNCDSKTNEYRPVSINNRTTIASLATYVDSFIVIEPHSFAAQTAAAELGKPLLPITPWRYLMDYALGKEVRVGRKSIILTPENTINVRPDKGRNIAATRIAANYKIDHVSFDKLRLSPTEIAKLSLSAEDQEKVKGKICAVYDDEFNTFGTLGKIAAKLHEYGAFAVVAVGDHAKLTGNWRSNLRYVNQVYITDSREPIGNIKRYIKSGKFVTIPLKNLVGQILDADEKGTNFWTDPNYNHMVLQTNGQDEDC